MLRIAYLTRAAAPAQTAAQAEAISALEERLRGAEEAREGAERAAASAAAALEERSLCGDTPGARTRAHEAALAARERARVAEAALQEANAAAEDAVRKQQRLAAKVAVAQAEMGLLTAEKALTQTKLTVAEETAIAAAAACGDGALPEPADALRRAAAEDARAAAAAVERARAAVTDSVRRADAAFAASAPRSAHAKDRSWHSRLELSFGDDADGASGTAGAHRGASKRRASLVRTLARLLGTLLWRLRHLALLGIGAAAVIHLQTGTEEAAEVGEEGAWRRPRELAGQGAQAAGRTTPLPLSAHPGGAHAEARY